METVSDNSSQLSSANMDALKKLLLFSVAMIVFPLATFFVLLKVVPKENVFIPVAASVLAAHLVIGAYVWVALNESDDKDLTKKD